MLTSDSITSDYISAAGSIPRNSSAAKFLLNQKVSPRDFNSFGSRRGNHEIMARATFSNIRNKETSTTALYVPLNKEMDIYDASQLYKQNGIPLIIIAGPNYGSGPSRDWAVKGQWYLVSKVFNYYLFKTSINNFKRGLRL